MNYIHYKLDDWIGDNYKKFSSWSITGNSKAIELLVSKKVLLEKSYISKNTDNLFVKYFLLRTDNLIHINWSDFSMNNSDEAVSYLLKNPEKIVWTWFSLNSNPRVIDYLEKNPDKIYWKYLSGNPSAIKLLKENKDKIDYTELSGNTNPEVLELFKNNKKKLNWSYLSGNPVAIKLLLLNKTSIKKIDWIQFNKNTAKEAIDFLIKHPQYICHYFLSMNESAIDYFKENPDRINWETFGSNPGIFKINYGKMKRNFEKTAEEIYTKAVNPKRICRLMEKYGEEEVYKNFFDE